MGIGTGFLLVSIDGHFSNLVIMTGFCESLLPPYKCHTGLIFFLMFSAINGTHMRMCGCMHACVSVFSGG